ncbi:chitin biosynthesis protein CHS5-like [Helianthus annuus]|uniref:chitin biosynthesis protein CHS5-like n=1 Tax=Helianthus annuus TaxID=4232 RepID=UPI000B907A63|nr:chitin biosynthesis protein CHS5-like [Helianthus annuus]
MSPEKTEETVMSPEKTEETVMLSEKTVMLPEKTEEQIAGMVVVWEVPTEIIEVEEEEGSKPHEQLEDQYFSSTSDLEEDEEHGVEIVIHILEDAPSPPVLPSDQPVKEPEDNEESDEDENEPAEEHGNEDDKEHGNEDDEPAGVVQVDQVFNLGTKSVIRETGSDLEPVFEGRKRSIRDSCNILLNPVEEPEDNEESVEDEDEPAEEHGNEDDEEHGNEDDETTGVVQVDQVLSLGTKSVIRETGSDLEPVFEGRKRSSLDVEMLEIIAVEEEEGSNPHEQLEDHYFSSTSDLEEDEEHGEEIVICWPQNGSLISRHESNLNIKPNIFTCDSECVQGLYYN